MRSQPDSLQKRQRASDRRVGTIFLNVRCWWIQERQLSGLPRRIADDLPLNAVVIEKVEPSSRLVVIVVEGSQPELLGATLDLVEICYLNANVVERTSFAVSQRCSVRGFGCRNGNITGCRPNVDSAPATGRLPLLANVPVK